MEQKEFVELAGGLFKNNKDYKGWSGQDKFENFWAFFQSDYKYVEAVYSGLPVDILRQKKLHSIEHIFPKSLIKKYLELKNQEKNIVNGATTNPLNFVAEHRKINEFRGHLPFDIENDTIIRNIKIEAPTYYTDWGRDHEDEWVVPHVSRGNVARTMLYMFLVYDVQELFKEHLNTYIYWCKSDPPTQWEIEYNQWVHEKHMIKNPFVTDDITQMINLLNDKELFNKLLVENRL